MWSREQEDSSLSLRVRLERDIYFVFWLGFERTSGGGGVEGQLEESLLARAAQVDLTWSEHGMLSPAAASAVPARPFVRGNPSQRLLD